MPREQLLFHRETNPGSGLANICFDLTNVLDMPGKKEKGKKKDTAQYFQSVTVLLNQARLKKEFCQECKIPGKLLEKEARSP